MYSITETISKMLSGSLPEADMLEYFERTSKQPITTDDLVAAAKVMRSKMVSVDLPGSPIDTCGTGGSGLKTINTSTLSAFIVAAAGGKVAKHGNRSASGNCGSFDLLETLGAKIDLDPHQEQMIYNELGIVFLFARNHHPAMKHVASARKKFGKPTIFNLLGPLCNPAGVKRQMIGTGNSTHAAVINEALQQLGAERCIVVTGHDGLDEVSVCDTTTIRNFGLDLDPETIFDPKELGLRKIQPKDIIGGTVAVNVDIARDLMHGKGIEAHTALVTINAAFALMLSELVDGFGDALIVSKEILRSGKVATLVKKYIECSNDI